MGQGNIIWPNQTGGNARTEPLKNSITEKAGSSNFYLITDLSDHGNGKGNIQTHRRHELTLRSKHELCIFAACDLYKYQISAKQYIYWEAYLCSGCGTAMYVARGCADNAWDRRPLQLVKQLQIWHSGRNGRCNRIPTVPFRQCPILLSAQIRYVCYTNSCIFYRCGEGSQMRL